MGEPIRIIKSGLPVSTPASSGKVKGPASQPVSTVRQIDLSLPCTVRDEYLPPPSMDSDIGRAAIRKAWRKNDGRFVPRLFIELEKSEEANKKFDPLNLDHKPRLKLVLEWLF